jgi:hypothetical protein
MAVDVHILPFLLLLLPGSSTRTPARFQDRKTAGAMGQGRMGISGRMGRGAALQARGKGPAVGPGGTAQQGGRAQIRHRRAGPAPLSRPGRAGSAVTGMGISGRMGRWANRWVRGLAGCEHDSSEFPGEEGGGGLKTPGPPGARRPRASNGLTTV